MINRAPFNALVDDDGSNTTGTPWNKAAIAGVILDPVDAALDAASAALAPLFSSQGSSNAAGANNLARVTIPGMALADTLEVLCTFWVAGPVPAPMALRLYAIGINASAGTLLDLSGPLSAGDISSYSISSFRVTIHPAPMYPNNFHALGYGVVTVGTPQSTGAVFAKDTGLTTWSQPWELYLQDMNGVPAGTILQWSCASSSVKVEGHPIMLIILLLFIALGITIGAGINRLPLWPAVLVVVVALLLAHWPAAWPH